MGLCAVESLIGGLFFATKAKDARPIEKPASQGQLSSPLEDEGDWLPESVRSEKEHSPFLLSSPHLAEFRRRQPQKLREQRMLDTV